MRILIKLSLKFLLLVAMVLLMGSLMKHGTRFFTGGSGGMLEADGSQISSEESDLMSTVLESAFRLLSGKASRSELANELSDKLYAQRADSGSMSELGIELVKAKEGPSAPGAGVIPGVVANPAGGQPDAKSPEKPGAPVVGPRTRAVPDVAGAGRTGKPRSAPPIVSGKSQAALTGLGQRMKPYTVELGLIPVVFLGMVLVSRVRRRKKEAAFLPEFAPVLDESDSETHEMKHPVHSLEGEEFELLVAVIYQRQGYRVSLPAGLGGGRNGDFKLSRKSERLLVQCQKMSADHRVPLERVRELHDAVTDASATGGLYVASCGFTWDARHFAKTRRIKLISAKTLDALLTEAHATPDEDLLAIAPWIPKFMAKVELTTPLCPICEAEMEQVKAGNGSAWLCSQRPECRGRRAERKYKKSPRPAAQDAGMDAGAAVAPQPAPESSAPTRREPGQQGNALPVTPPAPAKPAPAPVRSESTGVGAGAGSTPPVAHGRLGLHLPPPAKAKPAPSPVRAESTGMRADAGSTPPLAHGQQGSGFPVTPPATPKPARGAVRGGSTGRSPEAGSAPANAPMRHGFVLPETQPAKPEPAPTPARAKGTGMNTSTGSAPVAAPRRRGFIIEETQPAKPKPAPTSAKDASAGRNANAGATPAAAPRRRGFIIEETQPAKPKPAPTPAKDESAGRSAIAGGTPAAAPRRRGFILEETQPLKRKPAPSQP